MNLRLNKYCLIMLLTFSFFLSAEGQETFVTLTISNQSFPDASSGGSLIGGNVKLYRINFIVNDRSFCTLFASELNTAGNIARTVNIPCNTKDISIKLEVYYYHHEWNLGGTLHYLSLEKDFIPANLLLSDNGVSETRTYNQFTELDETISVNWTLDYKVEITPFKPVVNIPVGKKCYNLPFLLEMDPNLPWEYNNTSSVYDWEYGLVTDGFAKNPDFTEFMTGVTTNLDYPCQNTGGIDCYNLYSRILNCNYDFMTGSLYLFDDPYGNKENIAWSLLSGIMNQLGSSLSDEEQNFLYSYFVPVVLARSICPIPYFPDISVKDWIPLESGKSSTDAVEFISSSRLSPLTDKAVIGFRVKARNYLTGKSSPWSAVENVDLLPSPPVAGSISSIPSCVNRITGEIAILDITSPVYTNAYTYRIINSSSQCGDLSDNTTDINGNSIRKESASGIYKLCLSYSNTSIKSCVSEQVFAVNNLPQLNYQIFTKDVSCPGGSDGFVRINVSEWAGNLTIAVNDSPVYNTPDYTFSGLPKNLYEAKVSDFCIGEVPIVKAINQPDQVIINSISSRNPTCISNPDGGFRVEAAGISNGRYDYYIYKESDFPSGSPVTSAVAQGTAWENYNLPAGSYIINVRDNNNPACQGASSTVKILQAVVPIDLRTDNIKKVKCYEGSDGEIQVSATGGSGIYKFILGSTTVTTNPAKFSALKALSYTVSVRNSDQNCADAVSKIINVPTNPPLSITLTPRAETCFESGDGQISTTTTGGSGSYSTYSWEKKINGSWFPSSASAASPINLYAGDYRVKVTDSEGCSAIGITTVNEPLELTIGTVTSSDIKCFGEKSQINISAQGGNGGYSFLYSENYGASYSGFSSGALFSAGIYLLKVVDSKACETHLQEDDEDKEVRITEPSVPLNLSITSSNYNGFNISGYGRSDGSITITATGGNGQRGSGGNYTGYTYSVTGKIDQSNGVFTNLGSGVYSVKVTDGRGCIASESVTLTQPDILVLSVLSVEPVTCFGSATGEITINASGGVSPYSYQLNNNGYVSSGTFSGLSAATYLVSVKDRNGYAQSQSVTIDNKNLPIQIALTPQDVKCFGELNGQISATITGGSGGFSNLWEEFRNGSWQPTGTGAGIINDLGPGQYRLNTTDSDNCSLFENTVINQPVALTISGVVPHDIACFGTSGSIDINASGGKGGYQYFYSVNDGTSYTLFTSGSPMSAASYKLKVADLNSCETKLNNEVKITEPSEPLNFTTNLSDYNGFNISCFGMSDGSIIILPEGGNDSGYTGYTTSIDGGPESSATVYSILIAGSYNVKIRDGRGCLVTKQVTLTQTSNPVNLTVSKLEETKCFNDSSGIITLSASGGALPYEYRLGTYSYVTNNEFIKLPVGSYQFNVRDKNGCTTTLSSVVSSKYPEPSISLLPQDIKCYQNNDGSVQSSITGGSGAFGLKWYIRSGSSWQYLKSDSTLITALSPGEYRIQATDLAGCPSIYDSTTVYQRVTPLLISRLKLQDIICYGDSGSADIEASGGNGGYIYQYSRNNGSYSNYSPAADLPFSEYRFRVRDAKGCETIWPENLVITQAEKPLDITWVAKDYAGYNVSCFGNNDGRMIVTPSGGNGAGYQGYSFLMTGRPAQRDTLFEKLYAGDYILKVTDSRGCSLSKPVKLTQAMSNLKLWPVGIKMATCIDGSDGRVSLAASGGSLPYAYSSGSDSFVSESEFTSLNVNYYRFTVKDANGCTQIFDTSIFNIVPKMEISGRTKDVGCCGQNSGAINVSISGGAAPFNYRWKDNSSVNSGIDNLFKGNYTVSVTDAAGCKTEQTFLIKEPALLLSITAVSQPACVQLHNGSISGVATGGTPPYLYGVDQMKMQTNSSFQVYSGQHTVYTVDANDCRAESTATVGVRNTLPLVNFMVASSRYELDTLVIKDVSIPKPDSVTWSFSPETLLISSGAFDAKVKYNLAGIYPVKMTGYFGTCEYSLEKLLNIAPYDPLVLPKDKLMTGIEKVQVSPNPNKGQFKIKVKLYSKQQLQIKILDYYSKIVYNSRYPEALEFDQEINLPGVLPGTYILWIITEYDSKAVLFIVSQ